MKKLEWLDRGLFVSPIYYCLCISEDQLHRELKRLGVKGWIEWLKNERSDAAVHILEHEGKQCNIVCIKPTNKKRIEVYGLLVHEAVHIWQHVRESIGEQNPSPEFEAYVVQSIAQRLIASYMKQTSR